MASLGCDRKRHQISSGPGNKRGRLSSSDPSIPLPNCSPFLESQDDVINHIFRRLANVEERKMRLELVCERFRTRLGDRDCWKLDKHLVFDFDDGFNINGVQFLERQLPKAIRALLDRITVENVVFERMDELHLNESLLWNIATELRACIHSFRLKTIEYGPDMNPVDKRTAVLTNILACSDLSNVKRISTSFSPLHSYAFACAFWTMVHGCRQSLTSFYCFDQLQNENLVSCSKVLSGCPSLRSLSLGPDNDAELTLARIAVLCNTLKQLNSVQLAVFDHSPLVQMLDDQTKSRIREYHVFMFTPLAFNLERNNDFLKSVCNHFPNLEMLSCEGNDQHIDAETYLAVVENIFANFDDRGPYKFTLCLPVETALRFDILAEIGNTMSAKVVLQDYVYSCLKNELTVIFKF